MQFFFRLGLLLFTLFFWEQGYAQQICSGSLGDPIAGAGTDFGRGQDKFGKDLTNTTYRYVSGTPDDGEYTVAKSIAGLNGGWLQDIKNHTPNDPDGYMMVVNASFTKDIFYSATVSGLCPGTTYEFGAYIINILRNSGIKPNVNFAVYDSNHTLLVPKYSTGDIPEGGPNDWKQYALVFKTPANNGAITIELSNENPGGIGNDLALDDITFRACGPTIITTVDDQVSPSINACVGSSKPIKLKATLSSGYTDPAYHWQVDNGNGFVDLNGETNSILNLNTRGLAVGTYNYRVRVAERVNITSPICGVVGNPVSVEIYPIPVAIAALTKPVCVGESIQLAATGGTSYLWVGPNGFTSTDQNPIIPNAKKNMSGTYAVIVTANGCSSSSTGTEAKVVDAVVAKTNQATLKICQGATAQLQAIGPNSNTYTWFPTDGLSNPNIANPTVAPTKNTTYTVTVSNGVCSITDTTRVLLVEDPVISAGADIKLFSGQAKHLAGKITGTDYQLFWTPKDYLDDPTILNPIASPLKDITYTLHVVSTFGCFDLTSSVFVKVYPEIIIPSAFSPNGDGVNDTWTIAAAGAFDHAKIKVFNRYGNLVYQNQGIFTSWDGKYQGVLLPTGVYYYTAYFNEDFKTFSGPVTLIR
ncbi:gliding motility-associated-like protein [Pedobacter sp. UYP30]|uniref:gliding motility-associated C-terminal domain-containing protein n=1 Tax=Pedobacter sp. UYP30 TaxID=1756400 RepID=UPI003398614C